MKTKKTDLRHNAVIKRAQKKKYYELTSQGNELLQGDDTSSKEPLSKNKTTSDNYLPELGDDVLLEYLKDPSYDKKESIVLILENRGYSISIKNGKIKIRKKHA